MKENNFAINVIEQEKNSVKVFCVRRFSQSENLKTLPEELDQAIFYKKIEEKGHVIKVIYRPSIGDLTGEEMVVLTSWLLQHYEVVAVMNEDENEGFVIVASKDQKFKVGDVIQ